MPGFDQITPRPRGLLHRLGQLIVSAAYTGSGFIASFGPIILITREIDVGPRAGFFLFLSIFSPLATILSQKNLLAVYQSQTIGKAVLYLEEVVLFALTLVLVHTGTSQHFSDLEALALATTVFTHIHAVTATGAIQHNSDNQAQWAFWAMLLAVVRIGVTWLAMPLGAVPAFVAGSYAYLLVSLVLKFVATHRHRKAAAPAAEAVPQQDSWHSRIATLCFLMTSAVTFQVDKYLLTAAGQHVSVATSGALTMLLLSPLSLVFATIYRQRTRALFDRGRSARQKLPVIGRLAGTFTGFVVAYVVILLLLWDNAIHFMLPYLSAPFVLVILFAAAVTIDRLATLLIFSSQSTRMNLLASGYKAVSLTGIYIVSGQVAGDRLLISVYGLYVLAAIGYIALMAAAIFRKSGNEPE